MSIVFDVVLVVFLALMFLVGYKKGFLNKAWWLVDIALIVAVGMLLVPTLNESLTNAGLYAKLEGLFRSLVGEGSFLKLDPADAARVAQTVIAWLGLAIIIIILMAILKAVLKGLRKYKVFKVLDGILGGAYGVLISFVVLMVIGVLVGTFSNFEVIANAQETCSQSYLFKYIFGANPFQEFVNGKIPLGTWIANLIS